MPSAPPTLQPCVICDVHAESIKQFPCGCLLPIHSRCVYSFLRQGGVCAKCHQVWVAMDTATVTTAWDTGSQREWLISQAPHTQVKANCGACRITYFYCICCVLLLIGVCVISYVLYKVL
jgi:hypothetical protein